MRDGLLSPWSSSKATVSYTPPAVPALTMTTRDTDATITVLITNPAPTGGQPSVTAHDLYRRENGAGEGIRIAAGLPPGTSYVDRTPAAGVDYSYRVVAFGNNGTTSTSVWIGESTPAITYFYGGGYA